jgi:hypothetical protein
MPAAAIIIGSIMPGAQVKRGTSQWHITACYCKCNCEWNIVSYLVSIIFGVYIVCSCSMTSSAGPSNPYLGWRLHGAVHTHTHTWCPCHACHLSHHHHLLLLLLLLHEHPLAQGSLHAHLGGVAWSAAKSMT